MAPLSPLLGEGGIRLGSPTAAAHELGRVLTKALPGAFLSLGSVGRMETWPWILVALPFVAGVALFVRELVSLGRGRAATGSRPPAPGTDDLAAAVRRRATEHADSARGGAADDYAWEDRPLAARRNSEPGAPFGDGAADA